MGTVLIALRLALSLFFVVSGIDKYFHLLTNWEQYISPLLMTTLGERGTHIMMSIEGALEISIGVGVFFRPKIFAPLLLVWLSGIVINLLTTRHYYDIALHDTWLCIMAYALFRLSRHPQVRAS